MKILIVDDDGPTCELIAEVAGMAGHATEIRRDGRCALERLRSGGIDLVLCDLQMPVMGGLELVEQAKSLERVPSFVMISGCHDVESALQAVRLGALDYITKPFTVEEVGAAIETARVRIEARERVFERQVNVETQLIRCRTALTELDLALRLQSESSVQGLICALDAREHETGHHSLRVARYAEFLAGRIGSSAQELDLIRRAALLHDVGKIGVSDHILLKPGTLDREEWVAMREHTLIGARILEALGESDQVVDIVRAHHERFDGLGYPLGLSGDQIPIGARVFAVCDSYDAMTSDRPYRRAMAHVWAAGEIEQGSGSQFDPCVVKAFLATAESEWFDLANLSEAGSPKRTGGRRQADLELGTLLGRIAIDPLRMQSPAEGGPLSWGRAGRSESEAEAVSDRTQSWAAA